MKLEDYANKAVLAYFESDNSKYSRARLSQAMWNLRRSLEGMNVQCTLCGNHWDNEKIGACPRCSNNQLGSSLSLGPQYKPEQPSMHTYSTGAKRSQRMPRFDLIPSTAICRLAERFTGDLDEKGNPTGGALKYGESNWEKGLPTSDVINHIINHLLNYQDNFRYHLSKGIQNGMVNRDLMEYVRQGMNQHTSIDDDLAGAMWGIAVLMHQELNGMFHDDMFSVQKANK